MESRVMSIKNYELVKAMDTIVRAMSDERAVLNEWDVDGVPDEPEPEDFMYYATDGDRMDRITRLFFHICEEYGKDGLYVSDCKEFAAYGTYKREVYENDYGQRFYRTIY